VKRLRWFVMGAAAGVWAMRRAGRYTPPAAVRRWGGELKDAVLEGRDAARAREASLRADLERKGRR